MQGKKYIGVLIPAYLELARQALAGMRHWCEEHPEIQINILSESGDLMEIVPAAGSLDFIGCINWKFGMAPMLKSLSPNVVIISNKFHSPDYPQVINDDRQVGRMGVEHLYHKGYRTIGFFGSEMMQFSRQREEGYREAMLKRKLQPQVCNIHSADWKDVTPFVNELLANDAQAALFCASDLHAREAMNNMDEPRRLIPSRLAVLGVDADLMQNTLSPVSISSIRLSGERLGYEAAALLYRIYRGGKPPQKPILIPPQAVVTRQSTDAFAVDDPLVRETLEAIEKNMKDFPHVEALVKAMHTSRRTLETRFRKALGRTLHEELTNARINKARKLLATTELSIKEISELLGFYDQRRLTMAFSRIVGENPTEYRKKVHWTS